MRLRAEVSAGFAMTLALGIVLSMFSAMVVSRLLVNSLYGMGLKDAKYYGTKKEAQGISICGKEKDLLHDLLHSAACRSGQHDFHASDKGKRTELRP